jgi:hypothetical protein
MRQARADVPCQSLLAEAFNAEPKTQRHSADNPAQCEYFREAARKHETDESAEVFSAHFGQLLMLLRISCLRAGHRHRYLSRARISWANGPITVSQHTKSLARNRDIH